MVLSLHRMTYVPGGPEGIPASHSQTAEELLSLVYEELRRLAAARMANESGTQTLQPTAAGS
jgi:hypothetical protein